MNKTNNYLVTDKCAYVGEYNMQANTAAPEIDVYIERLPWLELIIVMKDFRTR